MTDEPHMPVMLDEVLAALAPAPHERMIDATFGAGGYSRALLERGIEVAAFDRDPSAARFAAPLADAHPGRFTLVARPFSEMEEALGGTAWDGVVFDVGVSSMQIDEAERGFSFAKDGPLDMRMSRAGLSAADLVNGEEAADLARLLWIYGEERASRRIAAAIVRRREEAPFTHTLDLAETVERALGGRRGAPVHPATRTFQALRIAVNDELGELSTGLEAAERLLGESGRLVVVTFHSLEDRIVKRFLHERSGRTPAGSRHRPPSRPAAQPSFTLTFANALTAGADEIRRNPRARSAKLRAGLRTNAPAWMATA